MRSLILPLALITCIVFSANAQKFKPGYYITLDGDSVKKDISIQKKHQAIDKVVTPEGLFLAPKDLSGFGLEGVNYVVKSVSVDKSPNLGVVTDTVFLEVMIRGKMSLYTMIDENEKAHFYIENESGFHELSVKLTRIPDLIQLQRLETYKGTLKGLFPSCATVFPAIDKTVFSRKGMQSIFKKLYICRYSEEAPERSKPENNTATDFGVLGGISSTQISFYSRPGHPSIIQEIKYGSVIDPTGGVFAETRFSRSKIFALRQELTYRQYKCTSDEYKLNDYSPNIIIGHVSTSYLKYAIIGRFYFSQKNFRPFVNLGCAPAYALSINHTLERKGGSNAGVTRMFQDVSKFEMGYFGGLGGTFKNYSLEFRYEYSTGLHPGIHDIAFSRVKTAYVTFSYRLKTGVH